MIRCGIDSVSDVQLPAQVLVKGDSFFEHTFTEHEQSLADAAADRLEFLRGRFAAKEAIFKALGMDSDLLERWTNIEVIVDEVGAPLIRLHGAAREHAIVRSVSSLNVSITHDQDRHLAMCVTEASGGKELS